jgi:hypothetical protein
MRAAAFPTFIVFSHANHPSNFTDHPVAPEIFSPSLSRVRAQGNYPGSCPVLEVTSVRYRWRHRLSWTMIRILDEKLRFLQAVHFDLLSRRERGGFAPGHGKFLTLPAGFARYGISPLSTDPYRVVC